MYQTRSVASDNRSGASKRDSYRVTIPSFMFDVSALQLSLSLDEVHEFSSENYFNNLA